MSSFCSATSKHFSTISRSHSVHKSVFISSFSFRWLKRSFAHCFVSLKWYCFSVNVILADLLLKPSANIQSLFFLASGLIKIFSIHFTIFVGSKYTHYVPKNFKTHSCRTPCSYWRLAIYRKQYWQRNFLDYPNDISCFLVL